MNKTKPNKPSQPPKSGQVSRGPEPARPASLISSRLMEDVNQRAEVITPFLADILQRPVTSHWGINE